MFYCQEKQGGSQLTFDDMRKFREVAEDCDFINLGFSGDPFTWDNSKSADQHVKERLDRGLGNVDWRLLFPGAVIFHDDYWGSDHRALKILLDPPINTDRSVARINKRFLTESWWLSNPDCRDIIMNSWLSSNVSGVGENFMAGLARCGTALKSWSYSTFGHIPRRLK